MNDKLKNLGDKEIGLICKEMGISREEVYELDDEGLMEVYDIIFDIELEEDMKDNGRMSERAVLAANILSVLEE